MPLILDGTNGVSGVDGTAGTPSLQGTDSNTGVFYATDIVGISTGGTERMRINSSGNVGIGVSPSAWGTYNGLELGRACMMGNTSDATGRFLNNAYYDGTNYRYIISGAANFISLGGGGGIQLFSAASGTAGNIISFTSVASVERTKSLALEGASPQAGVGITFPATQSASSDAKTLDDYEEGTWTPTIQFSGGSVGQTYAARDGFYTKVGNLVTVTCYVAFSNKGSSTGNAQLGGLPFTIGQFSTSGMYLDGVSFSGYPAIYAEKNQTYAVFLQQPAAGGSASALTNTNFASSAGVMINMSYRV